MANELLRQALDAAQRRAEMQKIAEIELNNKNRFAPNMYWNNEERIFVFHKKRFRSDSIRAIYDDNGFLIRAAFKMNHGYLLVDNSNESPGYYYAIHEEKYGSRLYGNTEYTRYQSVGIGNPLKGYYPRSFEIYHANGSVLNIIDLDSPKYHRNYYQLPFLIDSDASQAKQQLRKFTVCKKV